MHWKKTTEVTVVAVRESVLMCFSSTTSVTIESIGCWRRWPCVIEVVSHLSTEGRAVASFARPRPQGLARAHCVIRTLVISFKGSSRQKHTCWGRDVKCIRGGYLSVVIESSGVAPADRIHQSTVPLVELSTSGNSGTGIKIIRYPDSRWNVVAQRAIPVRAGVGKTVLDHGNDPTHGAVTIQGN